MWRIQLRDRQGVKGTVAGKQIAVGNAELFHDLSVDAGLCLNELILCAKRGRQ